MSIYPYIKSRRVFACPKLGNVRVHFDNNGNLAGPFGTSPCGNNNSYVTNGVMNGRLFAAVKKSSKMILTYEQANTCPPYSQMYPNRTSGTPPYFDLLFERPMPHNNGGDYLYVDGHVGWYGNFWYNDQFDDRLPHTVMGARR